jgi:hypothetical protein
MNSTNALRNALTRVTSTSNFRTGFALVLTLAGLLFGGCATTSPSQQLDMFVRNAPLPTLVPRGKELATAEAAAAKTEGDFTLFGVGASMEPVYLSGTALVVHPTVYCALRPGQAVVYVNRKGFHVAHMLVERTAKGWVAAGLNNDGEDETLVTSNNLVGIIKGAYAANDTVFRPDVAARIAMRDAVSTSTTVSLLR